MGQKQQIAKFGTLLDTVFSKKMERMNDQSMFTYVYRDLFKSEYNSLRKIVFSASDSGFLKALMKSYITLYDQYSDNRNLIRYYKSDQLFLFLVEQSAKVGDDGLLELWAAPLKGTDDTGSHSLRKRYLDLDPNFQRQVDIFIKNEREKRRSRRSLLDVLRDAYQKVHGKKPTNAELYDFNPKSYGGGLIENQIKTVQNRWLDARKDGSDANLEAFAAALTAISDWFREIGNQKVLHLFQVVKSVHLPPEVPDLSEDRSVLMHGLYAIACIRLHGAALRAGLYAKNLKGFTKEEVEFFAAPMRKSSFYYRSNIVTALSGELRNPEPPIGAIAGMLNTFLVVKARMPDITLLGLEETLRIQKTWTMVEDLTEDIGFASGNDDVEKIAALMTDARNAEAVQALREIGSTKVTLTSGQDLGSRVLSAGSKLGRRGAAGAVSVAYIDPDDLRIIVEFSAFKPQLFHAPNPWVADQQYGQKITEIHDATIGIVQLTELMFLAMGFMPVLVQAGFAGLIYEVAFTYASGKLEEQLVKIDPVLGKVLGLAIGIFSPRPDFKPKLKTDWVEHADDSLLAQKLDFIPTKESVADNGVSAERRGLGDLGAAEVDAFMARIEIHDDVIKFNSGVPLRMADLKNYLAPFKPGHARLPVEWRMLIAECAPLRKMIEAALKDPSGQVKLVRITEKQGQALPFKFQKSTMGSDHELHVTLGGQTYKFDGIIKGENNQWFIGESKFTFKDMMETANRPMASLHSPGKVNPTTSYHFQFVEEAQKQFKRYSNMAKQFGFDGVAVMTNTDFLWATFQQTSKHMKNVEIFLSRLDELDDFAQMFGKATADKAAGAASKATGAGNRGATR
jgi:hypothetical protein